MRGLSHPVNKQLYIGVSLLKLVVVVVYQCG